MAEKILLVDDEEMIVESIEYALLQEGYEVVRASNGQEALQQVQLTKPNLIVLDLMLPQLSGLEVCRLLRREHNDVPVIMLTAKGEEIDRVIGLEVGADDYLVKPIDPMELLFRIKSALRLTSPDRTTRHEAVEVGAVRLEPAKYLATVGGEPVVLTKLETAILRYLMLHPGQVFSADHLATQIAGNSHNQAQRSVDAAHAHIRHLRQKIEQDPKEPRYIVTMGRKGYYFAG
ncbi:MAG: response regulator transcription factor [Candidatus Sericytochromatia bacterium]